MGKDAFIGKDVLGLGRPRKEAEPLSETVGYRVTASMKERFLAAYAKAVDEKEDERLTTGDFFRELIDEGLERRGF